MGHHITAIITASEVNKYKAHDFDLKFFLENGFYIIALDEKHSAFWTKKLNLRDKKEDDNKIPLDNAATHFFAKKLDLEKYAIIQTDYFGGSGTQFAVVYEKEQELMAPQKNGINEALQLIGVTCLPGKDEFDSINLGKYRDFDDYYEKYWL